MKAPYLAFVLMCLMSGPALAGGGGLNLGWSDCGGLPSSQNEVFACDTNGGTHKLVASFVAPCCLTAVTRNDLVFDLQSTGDWFPDWWTFSAGFCRSSSLAYAVAPGGASPCLDYWAGRLPSIGTFPDDAFDVRFRIRRAIAISPDLASPIAQGSEAFSFALMIDNAKSTGPAACPGCATGVCIVLNSIHIIQTPGAPGGDALLTVPASRNWVTWQGGIGVDCYGATPVRDATWGSIKTLYR